MTTDPLLVCLTDNLRRYESLAIAFSGGVDSVFLLDMATEVLGREKVMAVTVSGVNFPRVEGEEADGFARWLGVKHIVVPWDAMTLTGFVENGPRRCYHCKKEVFGMALSVAKEWGAAALADGSNADDVGDYRPGSEAAKELGVVSPLRECGIAKRDIRRFLREREVAFWEKPSFACLASRVPYGREITAEALRRIEAAEEYLRAVGFREVRVRDHGDLARVEVGAEERGRFFQEGLLDTVDAELRRLGYVYTTLDMRGYRTGSMNEVL